ncbi:hypothetical protein ACQHIV_23665 [Kribbella sp. GL6]
MEPPQVLRPPEANTAPRQVPARRAQASTATQQLVERSQVSTATR